jgi:hypothetical protein
VEEVADAPDKIKDKTGDKADVEEIEVVIVAVSVKTNVSASAVVANNNIKLAQYLA